ncbi:MAG TPA: hypothetical protein VLX32_06655 [Candidatus Acidoferrum sp.]|nr:hypothetical protein [Candidatus Acidoferrum sp.]
MGAAVVDIPAFLQFRRDGAAIVSAGQQPREGKMVFAVFRFIPSGEGVLYALEESRRNQWLVRAFVLDALPEESTDVEGILENDLQIGAADLHSAFAENGSPQSRKRMLARGVELKDSPQHRRTLRVDFDAARSGIVLVTERRAAGINPLLGLLAHALLHFLA